MDRFSAIFTTLKIIQNWLKHVTQGFPHNSANSIKRKCSIYTSLTLNQPENQLFPALVLSQCHIQCVYCFTLDHFRSRFSLSFSRFALWKVSFSGIIRFSLFSFLPRLLLLPRSCSKLRFEWKSTESL